MLFRSRDRALIRFAVWVSLPFGQRFESAASNLRQRSSRLVARDSAVEVNGEVEVRGEGSTERTGRHHRTVLASARSEWDQRNHVDGTDPRVHTATSAALCSGAFVLGLVAATRFQLGLGIERLLRRRGQVILGGGGLGLGLWLRRAGAERGGEGQND